MSESVPSAAPNNSLCIMRMHNNTETMVHFHSSAVMADGVRTMELTIRRVWVSL